MLTNSTLENLNNLLQLCEKSIKINQLKINQINLASPNSGLIRSFWTTLGKERKLTKLITTNLLNAHNAFNKSFVLTLKERLQNDMVDMMQMIKELTEIKLSNDEKYLSYSEYCKEVMEIIDDALKEI